MKGNKKWLTKIILEIKRRNIIKAVIMYAASAFIILQLSDILIPALNLPPWFLTVIIILLALGFPLSAILSWIYDFKPDGIIKTESISMSEQDEPKDSESKRKFQLSDAIIIVLILAVGVLLYPRVFKRDKVKNLRNDEGKISLAVMPFNNLSGDTIYNAWQSGFQNLLISGLSNSNELEVRQYQTIQDLIASDLRFNSTAILPSIAGDLGNKLESKTVILGSLIKAGKRIRINAQLLNSSSEEIFKTFSSESEVEDDLFLVADTLIKEIRNFLEIEKIRDEYNSPEVQGNYYTGSAEAFRLYIEGYDAFMKMNFMPAAQWFYESIKIDSVFNLAYVMLSLALHSNNSTILAKEWCARAYERSENLPLKEKLIVEMVNAYYNGTPDEQIMYINQLLSLEKMNSFYWSSLGYANFNKENYPQAIIAFERALEIHEKWGSTYHNPFLYYLLGNAYHYTGNHNKETETFEKGLEIYPDHQLIVQSMAVCALRKQKIKKAEELIGRYIEIRENVTLCPAFRIGSGVGSIFAKAGMISEAEEKFRQAYEISPAEPDMLNELAFFLIEHFDDKERLSEGLLLIENALEIHPDNFNYLDTKGWGLYKLGKFQDAKEVLSRAWDNRPAYAYELFKHIQIVDEALKNI